MRNSHVSGISTGQGSFQQAQTPARSLSLSFSQCARRGNSTPPARALLPSVLPSTMMPMAETTQSMAWMTSGKTTKPTPADALSMPARRAMDAPKIIALIT